MATTNRVNQVLIPSGNQALLAAGNPVGSLLPGQLGVFNFHTGQSIDGTDLPQARDIFIAVGIDRTGSGTLEDVNKSAGQMIQARHTKSYTAKPYALPAPKIVDITNFGAKCEKYYALKVEFRNGKVYGMYGYNQFTKTFDYTTACCTDDCATCPEGDCNDLATGLLTNVNADTDKLVVASYIATAIKATITAGAGATASATFTIGTTAYIVPLVTADTAAQVAGKIVAFVNATTDTPYKAVIVSGAAMAFYPLATATTPTGTFAVTNANGTGVTAGTIVAAANTIIADPTALKALGVCLGIRLTSQPDKINTYLAINIKYYSPRGTDIIVSGVEGFLCNGAITITQQLAYEQGAGYDVRQMEYLAGGWNGKPGPYRVSELTGIEREGIEYFAVVGSKYSILSLTYDQESVGGWEEYLNNLETIFAIPCADSTTIVGLTTVLDRIFADKFDALHTFVGTFDCVGTVGAVDTISNVNADGIESIGD